MPKRISIEKAATLSLGNLNQPVITKYRLGILIFQLYRAGQFQNEPLRVTKDIPNSADFNKALNALLRNGILSPISYLPSKSTYTILGKKPTNIAEIACAVDPFAYMSHLSAMEYHALTDRLPKILYITTPSPSDWKKFAQQKMQKDCGDDYHLYQENKLPPLTRVRITKLRKNTVHTHHSLHLGAFTTIRDSVLRVATIGRTFLDMIRQPGLCGGIRHVIDVYKQHSAIYLNLITAEINDHGRPIDKVRAGYILEEACGVNSPIIDSWKQFVQRGGSRKLDSSSSYSPQYSESWCLSINTEEV